MPRYKYRARNDAGVVLEGVAEAETIELLKHTLRQRDIWVTKATIQSENRFSFMNLFTTPRVKSIELVMFAKQIGVMLEAGIPLVSALESVQEGASRRFKPVIAQIVDDIKSGKTYSTALGAFPTIFSPFFIGMMEVGEAGGLMPEMHRKVAAHLEQAQDLKNKLLMASLYPSIVLVVAISGIIIILTTAFPRIADVYSKYKVPLPFLTQVMLAVSRFITNFWYLLLLAVIGIVVLFLMKIHQRQPIKGFLDRMVFRVPVYKDFFRQVSMARYTHNLSLLLNSGIPVLKALDIIKTLYSNSVIRQYFTYLIVAVSEGEGLTRYLRSNKFFPTLLVSMTRTGEESGQLPNMMREASTFYESEVERSLKKFITIVEPVLIIIAAAGVFMVLIAFYLPMFKLVRIMRTRGGQ